MRHFIFNKIFSYSNIFDMKNVINNSVFMDLQLKNYFLDEQRNYFLEITF